MKIKYKIKNTSFFGLCYMTDTYQVVVKSTQVGGVGGFVHNEILFLKNGQMVAAFNGGPRDRTSGKDEGPSNAMSGNATLRVEAAIGGPGSLHEIAGSDKKVLAQHVITSPKNEAEFLKMIAKASDVGNYINSQSLDYSAFGIVTQNSNSVAYTIVSALGLKYPPEMNVNMPGNGKLLLPPNWKAQSENLSGDNLNNHLMSSMARLNSAEVQAQVKSDPNPYANAGPEVNRFQAYNPNKPLPYTERPLVVIAPVTTLATIALQKPTLQELNQSGGVRDVVAATLAHYINQSNPDQKILPDQAESIVKSNPTAALEILKDALKSGTLPDALKGDSENAKKLRNTVELYAEALAKDSQKNVAEGPKARSVTLADAIPSSAPMVVQGDGKLVAATVKPDTEMKVVDPTTGTVGPTTTARAITNPTPTPEPTTNQPQVAQVVKREMALG
jgi:hypothetical protein